MTEPDRNNKLIQSIAQSFEKHLEPLVQFIIYLRIPLTIAGVSYLFFSQIDQSVEVYRAIALNKDISQALLSTAFIFLLSLVIWYTARSLESCYKTPSAQKLKGCYRSWIPRILGTIPLFGLGQGILSVQPASLSTEGNIFRWAWILCTVLLFVTLPLVLFGRTSDLKRFKSLKRFASEQENGNLLPQRAENIFINIACFTFSILSLPLIFSAQGAWTVGVLAVLLLTILYNLLLLSWQKEASQRNWLIGACIVSPIAALPFMFFLPPTLIPETLGAIGLVALMLTIMATVLWTIFSWGQESKIPGVTILIGLILISSALNLNDNHRFRQSNRPETPLPTLESSFQEWLASRPDRDQFTNKPYPVYIAAAQGGGIYAAYHAATTFTTLTEYYPHFPQHIFAISGVSGGSLGASVFSSLVKAEQTNGQPFKPTLSHLARDLFSRDLLSPLLTMGLFPDLIQRFIVFPIEAWDRTTGLEVAFEKAWDKLGITKENPLQQSFYSHWTPQSIAPALALNTTIVETGNRLVLSPFKIQLPTENITLDEPKLDFKLSTAAGLSARFPYFTPVGWYKRGGDQSKLRLADGGYFDNSGIPTALAIGQNLQRLPTYGKAFEIIYLSLIDGPSNEFDAKIPSQGLNELLSPIRALFSAREARSRSAVELSAFTINDRICKDTCDASTDKFRTLFLTKSDKNKAIKLPLGWLISERSRAFIDSQIPNPKNTFCNTAEFQQSISSGKIDLVPNHNLCVVESIGRDLAQKPT
jgi:hypothetical protein